MSPSQIDTSASAATVTVTARYTDDLSGFDSGALAFIGPTGRILVASFGSGNRISGTALDGTYEATVNVPQYSAQGAWTILLINANDQALNSRGLNIDEARDAVGPVTFTNATP